MLALGGDQRKLRCAHFPSATRFSFTSRCFSLMQCHRHAELDVPGVRLRTQLVQTHVRRAGPAGVRRCVLAPIDDAPNHFHGWLLHGSLGWPAADSSVRITEQGRLEVTVPASKVLNLHAAVSSKVLIHFCLQLGPGASSSLVGTVCNTATARDDPAAGQALATVVCRQVSSKSVRPLFTHSMGLPAACLCVCLCVVSVGVGRWALHPIVDDAARAAAG
jgi:hypothetical protein